MKAPKLPGKYNVKSKVVINAPKQKVWQVMEDFGNVYTWAPGVTESHSIGSKESGMGAARHCKLDGFGTIDEYVTQWVEGTGFVYDVTPLGPLNKSFSCWWLTALENGSTELEVVLSYDIRYGLFGKVMHSLIMRKKLESSLPDALNALKNRVETGKLVRPYLTKKGSELII
ncbi:SRPBCC family protein [Pseudoalteromonas denitrificans]|uniref:Polyketide cyclase / dehydrase and lipid transport n=1 Tax=Pseudoalteromonas denitrificans DSM 6059 TaxID=1123010 RepID=A0A1I1LEF8_9GAMM|nr:SRPBCC family protein [Pseudoalteromonas denitrificans]SFC71375.1 Polyketide cyclase / dehydrase and lipid transport [Pseudoalteromonas denitrificans DSM 6059]